MPASTSSPPPSSDLAGLKSSASYDPVLPSSPEVERLTPVPTSQQSTAGSPGDTSIGSHYTPGSNLTLTSPNGMTPREADYMGVDGFESFDDHDYLLNSEFNYFQEAAPPAEEPEPTTSATTAHSRSEFSRRSTGLATHSSHLMSPELSDAPSPETPRDDHVYAKTKLLGGGDAMSRESTYGTAAGSQPPFMAQTPATTTGSSSHISPDPGQGTDRFAAPRVQVESWSRGDSPGRTHGFQQVLRRKRSHGSQSSSHLAPDQSSSEENHHDDRPDDATPTHLTAGHSHGRAGLDPALRQQLDSDPIASLADQVEKAKVEEKNQGVSKWLAVSEVGQAGLPPDDTPPSLQGLSPVDRRLRARSTAGRPHDLQADALGISQRLRAAHEAQIPGPGVLIDEKSGDEEEDDDTGSYAESAPASIDGQAAIDQQAMDDEAKPQMPPLDDSGPAPEDASPWVDPIYFPSHPDAPPGQPATSNAAMMRFLKRAQDIETSSRVATWGTSARRLSDSDLQRVFGSGGLFSRLSISKDRTRDKDQEKDKEDWRNNFKQSVENAALKYLPKRIPSTRRKHSEPARPLMRDSVLRGSTDSLRRIESPPEIRDRKEGLAAPLRRISSTTRRTPQLNMSAVVASATNIATLGAGASVNSSVAASPTKARGPFKLAKDRLSRHSSQDGGAPSLTGLLAQQGGPPVPNLTSPGYDETTTPINEEKAMPEAPPPQPVTASDDEEKETKGVVMNLEPHRDMIIPTFEGFKTNIRNVNPRLPPFLVERLGQEQLRRYKKLVEFKVKHAQHKANNTCESGDHCVERGGAVKYFPSKAAQKEPKMALAEDADEDEDAVADGVVTDATFPPGVPMPPVKRLPAEFECPLCFQVKKLQKPSDWSKHVHEDLQPFTCTFPTCPDPKSFKRKADWVRHENERHRQLEWWRCTEEGCAHQCFRRDNFVQHLVREHKMPEPKAKATQQPNKKAVRGPAKGKARTGAKSIEETLPEDRVLVMVETCRHENGKNAVAEPCRFCGNVCNSFKKLTVHLARHMEQISMPVLDLVAVKDVTAETVISPIESKIPPGVMAPAPADDHSPYARDNALNSVSPYEAAVGLDRGVPELPGAFAPLQGAPAFHAAPYANPNFPQWSNASMPAETSALYGSGAMPPQQQTWIPQSNMYSDAQTAAAYGMVSPMQARMISPVHAPNAEAYGAMNGGASPALATSYPRGDMMEAGLDRQGMSPVRAYGMNPTHAANGMAMDYDSKGPMPYSQAPNQSMGYQSSGQSQQSQQQHYYSGGY